MKHSFTSDAHLFSSLSTNFGPFGEHNVHYHPCSHAECDDAILVGDGPACAGKGSPHTIKVYRGGKWIDLHQAIGAKP